MINICPAPDWICYNLPLTEADVMSNNFIYQTSKEMQDIALPLQKYFDINFFGYIKAYKDSTNIVALTTSQTWAEWFTMNIHNCHLGNIAKQNIKISLWKNMPDQTIYNIMHYDFNISHGIRFFYEYENHIELFSYATSRNNRSILTWYLNNVDILEKFIVHFKHSGKDLIKLCEKKQLQFSENTSKNKESYDGENILINNKNEFLKEISNNTISIFCKDNQQMRCVKLLAEGLMIKEIANQLDLSPKTVEHYLSNVRKLVGAKNSKSLVAMYYSQMMNLDF